MTGVKIACCVETDVCYELAAVFVQAPMQSQMSAGQIPCSPPLAANGQMPSGPRPGMTMGPGMGGPVPPMCGQMMGPGGGYGAPMSGGPGGYSNQMMQTSGSNQMMMGSGPAASVSGGMTLVDNQMGVGPNMASHLGVGGPNIPSSQPLPGPGMPGPISGAGGFMHGAPSMASQMNPNGSSMMAPSVSGPMSSAGGPVSTISSSLPAGSPAGVQMSLSSSASTVASTMSNQVPGGPFMSSGSSMVSQVPPSSGTSMQVSNTFINGNED